jgi:predicted amidohydrolase
MRVGFVQTSPRRLRRDRNLRDVETRLAGAPAADLWVLPELFSTGYLFLDPGEAASMAEEVPRGPTTSAMISWARRHVCALVGGVLLRKSASGVRGLHPRTPGQGMALDHIAARSRAETAQRA